MSLSTQNGRPLALFSLATGFQGYHWVTLKNFHPFLDYIHTHSFLLFLLKVPAYCHTAAAIIVDYMEASLCSLLCSSDSAWTWFRMNYFLGIMEYCLGHLYLQLDGSDISQFSYSHMVIWCPQLDTLSLLWPTRTPGIVIYRYVIFCCRWHGHTPDP